MVLVKIVLDLVRGVLVSTHIYRTNNIYCGDKLRKLTGAVSVFLFTLIFIDGGKMMIRTIHSI